MMKRAHEDARRVAAEHHGLDQRFGPGARGNGLDTVIDAIVDYGKPVSRGFLRDGSPAFVEVAAGSGRQRVRVWSSTLRGDHLVTRVKVRFEWDGKRWQVMQLFPDATRLDTSTGRYAVRAHHYVRR